MNVFQLTAEDMIHTPARFKDGGPKYKYVLTQDLIFPVPDELIQKWMPIPPEGWKAGSRGRAWLTFSELGIRVSGGYATDGCSPKRRAFGKWLGTPDFDPGTIAASFLHDACYQHMDLPKFPFTRREIDWLFYLTMKHHDFKLAETYYGAVRLFGNIGHRPNPEAAWL